MARLTCRAITLLALLIAAAVSPRAHADDNLQLIEQEIKAGLLYNFLKYTQWPSEIPSSSVTPVAVCLFGGDPFDGHLKPMSGRTVNQRVIEVRSVGTFKEADGCALLFIDGHQKGSWAELHKALTGKGILTVSDFDGFAASGGMIEFTRLDNRIGVKINIDALADARFQVQDRLLRLASAVHTTAPER